MPIWTINNMKYHDRIEVSEGIDLNKTREWKECNICHYSYFLKKALKFKMSAMDVMIC